MEVKAPVRAIRNARFDLHCKPLLEHLSPSLNNDQTCASTTEPDTPHAPASRMACDSRRKWSYLAIGVAGAEGMERVTILQDTMPALLELTTSAAACRYLRAILQTWAIHGLWPALRWSLEVTYTVLGATCLVAAL